MQIQTIEFWLIILLANWTLQLSIPAQDVRDSSSIETNLVTACPGKKSQWRGFDRYDFTVSGRPAILVVPKLALGGKPWAWRAEFFGVSANVDAALVTNGFYLAYLSTPDMFGSPEAVECWNKFYDYLTQNFGLAKKPALIALSRGGLYAYNWSIANPSRVACIYADAPVCDFKSWPGGRVKNLGKGEGELGQWQLLLKAYKMESDEQATAYRRNPIDNLEPLAAANVPLLHVYGDADAVVPWEENTKIVQQRYRQLGGQIELIQKHGVGHHPHGLADPTPIVNFIMKYASSPN